MREEYVHHEECREMEDHSETKNPQANASPENCEGKKQLPEEHESNGKRQVLLYVRQPEGKTETRVVQIVERVKDRKGGQIIDAKILQSGDAKFN